MSGPADSLSSVERDFLTYRIMFGYHKTKIKDKSLYVKSPACQLMYDAHQVYFETLSECRNSLTDDEIQDLIDENKLVTEYDKDQYNNVLPKHIEYFKKEIYRNFNDKSVNTIREHLNTARAELNRIFNIMHQFDQYTADGVARFAKWRYLFLHSFYDLEWNKTLDFEWSMGLSYFYECSIPEKRLSEIAISDEWLSMYNVSSKNLNIFHPDVKNTTYEQRRLLKLTEFYQNVLSSENPPSIEVIKDEDALDGWLIIRKEEYEAKKKEEERQGKIDSITNKYGRANEIYIPAKEGASGTQDSMSTSEIYNMNDNETRNIIKQRVKRVQEKGIVTDLDFDDVRMDINRRIANANRR